MAISTSGRIKHDEISQNVKGNCRFLSRYGLFILSNYALDYQHVAIKFWKFPDTVHTLAVSRILAEHEP